MDLKLSVFIVKTDFGEISQCLVFGVVFVVLGAEWIALHILGRSGTAGYYKAPNSHSNLFQGRRTESSKLFQGAVTLMKERRKEKGRQMERP